VLGRGARKWAAQDGSDCVRRNLRISQTLNGAAWHAVRTQVFAVEVLVLFPKKKGGGGVVSGPPRAKEHSPLALDRAESTSKCWRRVAPSMQASAEDRSQSTAKRVPVQSGVGTANSPSTSFAVWAAPQTRPLSPPATAARPSATHALS